MSYARLVVIVGLILLTILLPLAMHFSAPATTPPLVPQKVSSSSSPLSSQSPKQKHSSSSSVDLNAWTRRPTLPPGLASEGDGTGAQDDATSGSSNGKIDLFTFVSDLVQFHSGNWSGIFDPLALLSEAGALSSVATKNASSSNSSSRRSSRGGSNSIPCQEELQNAKNWNMQEGLLHQVKSPPRCMSNLTSILHTLHYHLSLGLSRLALDSTLSKMYAAVVGNSAGGASAATAREALELDIARIVSAHLQMASIVLQTYADGFGGEPEALMQQLDAVSKKRRAAAMSDDPESSGGGGGGGRWKRSAPSSSSSVRADSLAARWLRLKCRHITLFSPSIPWGKQLPVAGRFWNNHRGTLSCTSVTRGCENPEGCRLMCNVEYAFSGRAGTEFEIVGFGSNNEFDWEESMIRALQRAGLDDGAAVLGSITTFDCTLLTRKPPGVRPSPLVKTVGDKFRFVPFCLGGAADPEVDGTNDQNKPLPFLATVSPASVHAATQDASSPATAPAAAQQTAQLKPGTMTIAELRRVLEWQDELTRRKRPVDMKFGSARRINLLKMDIESFEFVALPRWMQLDLHLVSQQLQQQQQEQSSSSSPPLVDFTEFPFLDVQQLQVELHRRGHTKDKANGVIGSLWMLWNQLTYYALGFVPVVAEKNHFDNCCFEQVLVQHRYFLQSEGWLRNAY